MEARNAYVSFFPLIGIVEKWKWEGEDGKIPEKMMVKSVLDVIGIETSF